MRLDAEPSSLKTGVYAIRHVASGKVYVGSAAVDLRRRFGLHQSQLGRGVHHSKYLQAAWNKYGAGAFEFVVLAYCLPEWCLAIEQIHINAKKAADPDFGYNMTAVAGSFIGMKHSAETKKKMSAWQIGRKMPRSAIDKRRETMARNGVTKKHSESSSRRAKKLMADPIVREKMNAGIRAYWKNPDPEHVKKMREAAFTPEAKEKRRAKAIGRIFTNEHKMKLSNAIKGRKQSKEARLKMSEGQKRRYLIIQQNKAKARDEFIGPMKPPETRSEISRRVSASIPRDPLTGKLMKKTAQIPNGLS